MPATAVCTICRQMPSIAAKGTIAGEVLGYDGSGLTTPADFQDIYEVLKAAAKVKKLWVCYSAGNTPLYNTGMRPGDFVIDQYNNTLDVVTGAAVVSVTDA